MGGETFGVDRRRGDDHLEVGATGEQLREVAEQQVDVEAALVRLVDDDRVVATQQPVVGDLGQQDAVGHDLDERPVAERRVEAHLVADDVTEFAAEFLRDPVGDGARGNPPRLGVADDTTHTQAQFEADLRQLGGLARAGLAGHDDDLVVANRCA